MNDTPTSAAGATAGRRSQPAAAASTPTVTDTDSQATASSQPQAAATDQAADQAADQGDATLVDQVLDRGKQWINDSGLGQRVNDLPQTLRDLGNQALGRVNSLSTTQKIVGGAILAAGIGWLATRGRSAKSQSTEDAYAAAAGTRPGSRYSSNSYVSRGPGRYTSSAGDTGRGSTASNPSNQYSSGNYGGRSSEANAPTSSYGDSRSSYPRGNHFSNGDADGFSNGSDE